MGWFDALLGRSRVARPVTDPLFQAPGAAITLEVGGAWVPTGVAAVCFRPAEGAGFERLVAEILSLTSRPADAVEVVDDAFGYRWVVLHDAPEQTGPLVADIHAAMSTLTEAGFASQVLCAYVGFRAAPGAQLTGAGSVVAGAPALPAGNAAGSTGSVLALVYLPKRGTWYPFVPDPTRRQQRDTIAELQVKSLVAGDLTVEADLGRWMALWDAPGLT